MKPNYFFYILYYLVTGGAIYLFAYFYGRKTKRWRWSEYFLIALAPFVGVLALSYFEGPRLILYFFLCGIIGSVGELMLGIFCKIVLGRRLWYYTKAPLLGGHTSLLNFPFWAGGGMLFFFLAKIFM